VIAVPGLTPKSPVTTVAPVLVTVEPAKTAKLAAVPRFGAVARAEAVKWFLDTGVRPGVLAERVPLAAKTMTASRPVNRVKDREFLNI
jgi:hypothetical protein